MRTKRTYRRAKSPKRRSNRAWKMLLDSLCRQRVFDRDGHRCVRCGSVEWLQWSHVYTRRILCTRWNLSNSKTLCASCHRWWHDNPAESGPWWVEWAGQEAADHLAAIRRELPPVDFEEVERQLREGM